MLATYAEAELPAVAAYFRSLACAHPFTVARENLLLLFEHNRERCGCPACCDTLHGRQQPRARILEREAAFFPSRMPSAYLCWSLGLCEIPCWQ